MPAATVFAQSVTRSRLSEEIVDILQRQIISGSIAPGEKLPTERELAESFKVNRTTVREALRKLEHLELIDVRHGDGLYVKNYLESSNFDLIKTACRLDPDGKPICDILEVRRIIVPQMAYLAAQRASSEDILKLEQIIADKRLTWPEKDMKVHEAIAHAGGNVVYIIMLNFFNHFNQEYSYLYFEDERNLERSRKFHRDILDALKRKKPEAARRIMLDVLDYAEDAVKKDLARRKK